MSDLLEIRDLSTCFRTEGNPARAVDGLTLTIREGETYAIVGESGSGKSVTALSVMQLLPKGLGYIERGSVMFCGSELTRESAANMREIRGNDISMIFQEPMTALNPVFTVGQQISEVFRLHQNMNQQEAHDRSLEMLEMVGIPEPDSRISAYPHELSGGMQQRVMIAMALACKPKLLIADEPTTALDVTIQSQILSLMKTMQEKTGTAILLITHDMGVVREIADRVGVMYGGKLVEEAPVEELFENPAHPYTELLMRALPSRTKRTDKLDTIEGLVPAATEVLPGCRFENRCPARMEQCAGTAPVSHTLDVNHSVTCHLFNDDKQRGELPVTRESSPPNQINEQVITLEATDLKMHFPLKKSLLGKPRGMVKAVDGVSLKLYQGETLALVGESGCGKTTVGKSIIQIHKPGGGTIQFNGEDILGMDKRSMKAIRRKIQFVFQDPFSSLDPRQPIGEIIIEGMVIHGIGKSKSERLAKARTLLERVGLNPDMIYRYAHEFSGGQRQRIVLARALSTDPDLLICDEATSALDVSVQAQILNLLKDLRAEMNLSYLFITHDLSVVRYLADRVAVMYLGRIVEEGTTSEIFNDPKHPYTQALLSAAPQISDHGTIEKIILEGDVPSPINPPAGCHFHPRCPMVRETCSAQYPQKTAFSDTHSCKCLLYK